MPYEGAFTKFKVISVEVKQGRVLGLPLSYLFFTADNPTSKVTVIGIFVDGTIIVAKDASQQNAMEKLQTADN